MGRREILLASGIKIAVDEEDGGASGFVLGDIFTADGSHAKWRGKEVEVVGFSRGQRNRVVWGKLAGSHTADCAQSLEGLLLVRRAVRPAA